MRLSRNCDVRRATAFGLAALAVLGCGSPRNDGADVRVERHLAAMGTSLRIEVSAASRPAALAASEAAFRAVRQVEARLSTWNDESELARLNASPVGETVRVSAELREDLEFCQRWQRATDGAFDPNVGALVRAWGLRGAGRVPSSEELEAARSAGDFAHGFALESAGVVRRNARAQLEEGGFGKGVGLDAALHALRERGVSRAVLDLGGQVATLAGTQPLRWSIAHPDDRERAVLAWEFSGGSIATSGNSERSRNVAGQRVGHLLDPRRGSPAEDFGSVSVWAERAADADALSTALFVMGPQASFEFSAARDDIAVVWIERRPTGLVIRASACLRDALTPLVADLEVQFVAERAGELLPPITRP